MEYELWNSLGFIAQFDRFGRKMKNNLYSSLISKKEIHIIFNIATNERSLPRYFKYFVREPKSKLLNEGERLDVISVSIGL